MKTTVEEILANPEFQRLGEIGGHKVYHLEGSALVHTMMVYDEAVKMWGEGHMMTRIALLHDIGKIYTSIRHGDGDWEYPDHAQCGSFRGILCKFISEQDDEFREVQWYIANHIKPLFWRGRVLEDEWAKVMRSAPSGRCTVENLVRLALCDVRGSVSVEPQTELIDFLSGLL